MKNSQNDSCSSQDLETSEDNILNRYELDDVCGGVCIPKPQNIPNRPMFPPSNPCKPRFPRVPRFFSRR